MSIDAMKQALAALNDYEPNEAHKVATALRAAIEQAQGLAEKVPARGTLLEQTLGKVWDEMPHAALMDAIIGGTGVMLGDKRIDPASIYKQPEQEPVAWMCSDESLAHKGYSRFSRTCEGAWNIPVYTAPRQWQGLTDAERGITAAETWGSVLIAPQSYQAFARAIEAKLKEKNT